MRRGRRGKTEARRQAILALAEARPGCSGWFIGQAIGVAWSLTQYHLGILVEQGALVRQRHGHAWQYYRAGASSLDAWAGQALANPKRRRLYEWLCAALRATGGLREAAAVAYAASSWLWPRSTTQTRIKHLVAAGLLVRDGNVLRLPRAPEAPAPVAWQTTLTRFEDAESPIS